VAIDQGIAARAREQLLLESWEHYVQTIGPCVVAAYRGEQLLEPPYVYVFNRVKDEMQRIALEWLLEEELRQDEQEGSILHL
jgi:hypothetical protein